MKQVIPGDHAADSGIGKVLSWSLSQNPHFPSLRRAPSPIGWERAWVRDNLEFNPTSMKFATKFAISGSLAHRMGEGRGEGTSARACLVVILDEILAAGTSVGPDRLPTEFQ